MAKHAAPADSWAAKQWGDASATTRVVVCGAGLFLAFELSSFSQEYLQTQLQFRHPALLAAVIPLGSALVGIASGGLREHRAPLRAHAAIGGLAWLSFYLSSLSSHYLSFPAFLVSRAAKLVPTMVVGSLWLRKRYLPTDWLAAALAVAGLAACLLADTNQAVTVTWQGLAIISVALFLDGLSSNAQEAIFKQFDASSAEVSAYSYGIAALCSLASGLAFTSLAQGLRAVADSGPVAGMLLVFALANYGSSAAIITMLKLNGAASTAFTSAVCKALTMAASYILFPKAIKTAQIAGMALVVSSVALAAVMKGRTGPALPASLDDSQADGESGATLAGWGEGEEAENAEIGGDDDEDELTPVDADALPSNEFFLPGALSPSAALSDDEQGGAAAAVSSSRRSSEGATAMLVSLGSSHTLEAQASNASSSPRAQSLHSGTEGDSAVGLPSPSRAAAIGAFVGAPTRVALKPVSPNAIAAASREAVRGAAKADGGAHGGTEDVASAAHTVAGTLSPGLRRRRVPALGERVPASVSVSAPTSPGGVPLMAGLRTAGSNGADVLAGPARAGSYSTTASPVTQLGRPPRPQDERGPRPPPPGLAQLSLLRQASSRQLTRVTSSVLGLHRPHAAFDSLSPIALRSPAEMWGQPLSGGVGARSANVAAAALQPHRRNASVAVMGGIATAGLSGRAGASASPTAGATDSRARAPSSSAPHGRAQSQPELPAIQAGGSWRASGAATGAAEGGRSRDD
jgi:adenosine 3'-phospho 5'-phosphosulfate transporter B2